MRSLLHKAFAATCNHHALAHEANGIATTIQDRSQQQTLGPTFAEAIRAGLYRLRLVYSCLTRVPVSLILLFLVV